MNQIIKSKENYSFQLLAKLIAEIEFEESYFHDLVNREFEFNDAVVLVSGCITLFRKLNSDEINSISCDFTKVIISYDSEIETELSFRDLLELETLTEKYF